MLRRLKAINARQTPKSLPRLSALCRAACSCAARSSTLFCTSGRCAALALPSHQVVFGATIRGRTARHFHVYEVSADKAYSSRANLELVEGKGATPISPSRSTPWQIGGAMMPGTGCTTSTCGSARLSLSTTTAANPPCLYSKRSSGTSYAARRTPPKSMNYCARCSAITSAASFSACMSWALMRTLSVINPGTLDAK